MKYQMFKINPIVTSVTLLLSLAACNDSNESFGGGGGRIPIPSGQIEPPTEEDCFFYNKNEFGEYLENLAKLPCVKKALNDGVDPNGQYVGFFNRSKASAVEILFSKFPSKKSEDQIQVLKWMIAHQLDLNRKLLKGETLLTMVMNLEEERLPVLEFLIQQPGIDLNLNGRSGYPLEIALENSWESLATSMINRGADFNKNHGQSLLLIALSRDLDGVARLMLDKGMSIESNGDRGLGLLKWAIHHERKWLFELLIAKKVPVNEMGEDGVSPLMVAVQATDRTYFNELLKRLELKDLNQTNGKGKSALVQSIENGHYDVTLALLSKGVDVSYHDENAQNLLHIVALKGGEGSHGLMDRLLQMKLDVNAPNKHGDTPIVIAVQGGNVLVAKSLQSRGAKLDYRDANGNSLLHKAANHGDFQMTSFLLEHLPVDIGNNKNQTPLLVTASEDVGRLLLRKGANIAAVDLDGHHLISYLMWSFGYKLSTEYLKFLLDKGMDLNADVSNGMNPVSAVISIYNEFDVVIDKRGFDLVQLMVDRHANLHSSNTMGMAPIHYVTDPKLLRFFLEKDRSMKNDLNRKGKKYLDLLNGHYAYFEAEYSRPGTSERDKMLYSLFMKRIDELKKVLAEF